MAEEQKSRLAVVIEPDGFDYHRGQAAADTGSAEPGFDYRRTGLSAREAFFLNAHPPKGGGRLPFGAKICVGPVRRAQCSAPEYPSPLVAKVIEAEHGQFTGRIVMSGKALTVRSIPVRGYPDAKLLITDKNGRAVTITRAGRVLRFQAVAPEGAALTKWMRVCVGGNPGYGVCAPPGNPYVLVRRVEPEFIVDGRVTARVVEFSRTWATKSVSVAG